MSKVSKEDGAEDLDWILSEFSTALSLTDAERALPRPLKIEKDSAILTSILTSFLALTEDFNEIITKGEVYKLKCLCQDDLEYQMVRNKFISCMHGTTKLQCKILRVKQIQKALCPYLEAQFRLNEEKKRYYYSRVCKEELYHGTKKVNIGSICEDNFNWRLCGTQVGTKFGRGISFARYASYATFFPKFGVEHPRAMILTNILYTHKYPGNSLMRIPPEGYDTSIKPNGDVIVKYEDADYCPQFVIYYG